jgi:hypothetical protein
VDRWRNSAKHADYLAVADTGSTDDMVERLFATRIQVHRIAIVRGAAMTLAMPASRWCPPMPTGAGLAQTGRKRMDAGRYAFVLRPWAAERSEAMRFLARA